MSDAGLLEAAKHEITDRHSLGCAAGHCFSPVFFADRQSKLCSRPISEGFRVIKRGRDETLERHLPSNDTLVRAHAHAPLISCLRRASLASASSRPTRIGDVTISWFLWNRSDSRGMLDVAWSCGHQSRR